MRTYYDGPDALVTENHFIWRTDPLRAFIIGDLRDVRLVQRDVGSPRTITALAAVAAAALIVAPGWLLIHTVGGIDVATAAERLTIGMPVKAVWKDVADCRGTLDDIDHFTPIDEADA